MKKFIALVLALAVVCSLGIYSFAAGSVSGGTKTENKTGTATTDVPTALPETADEETSMLNSNQSVAAGEGVSEGDEVFLVRDIETDEAEGAIPASEVKAIALKDADKKLSKEDAAAFKAAYAEVSKITGKTVKYFFWLQLPENALEEGQYIAYRFACDGKDVAVTVNGKSVDVEKDGDAYTAKITESGAVAVTVA